MNTINLFVLYMDGAEAWQLDFQDCASPIAKQLVFFHDYVMLILVIIFFMVTLLMIRALINKFYYKFLVEGTTIEVIWTITPAIILLLIAFPSLQLLYTQDELIDPSLTIKVIGNQWYWSYEYSDFEKEPLEFDSYMIPTSDLKEGDLRLLEVDNRLVVPINTHIRALVTGADVIHCFTVPSLGFKIDAVPGRLNQTSFFIDRPGIFYGQCSEICGSEHSFMPIVIEATSISKFNGWVESRLEELPEEPKSPEGTTIVDKPENHFPYIKDDSRWWYLMIPAGGMLGWGLGFVIMKIVEKIS